MKELLITRLFDEFDKDKEVIKENLLKVMNQVTLDVSDGYNKAILIIKIEGVSENDKTNN